MSQWNRLANNVAKRIQESRPEKLPQKILKVTKNTEETASSLP
jgi:hypothetical protein